MRIDGKVYLVGVGPGNPELITLKALRVIEEADVILYDRLIPREILAHAKPGADLIFVGKEPGNHAMNQKEIEHLMIRKAKEGKIVARLKGGDPLLFARGGEELIALSEAGVDFEVVPGVSSVNAAASSSYVPLTLRGISSTLIVTIGREAEGKRRGKVDLKKIAKLEGTIAILMGLSNLPKIQRELLSVLSPDTPVALVEKATMLGQRVLTTTLADVVDDSIHFEFGSPVVLLVGEVVSVRRDIVRLKRRRLKILVPRPSGTTEGMKEQIERAGYICHVVHVADPEPLDFQLEGRKADYIVFTSQISAKLFVSRGLQLEGKVIAIGPSTAEVLEDSGFRAYAIPESYTVRGLMDLFSQLEPGDVILFRSAEADWELENFLSSKGYTVRSVRTHRLKENLLALKAAKYLLEGKYDALVATSPFLARLMDSKLRELGSSLRKVSEEVKVISLGPVTTEALASLGVTPSAQAPERGANRIAKALEVALG